LKPLIDHLQKKTYWFFLLAVFFVAIAPLFIKNDFYLDGIILIFIWGAFAGAWNIISGQAGMVSLGHNAFFGIGAYTSTLLLLHWGLTPWIGMFIGGVLALDYGVITLP
jgi:branched-chain amino acid transport system permease protein